MVSARLKEVAATSSYCHSQPHPNSIPPPPSAPWDWSLGEASEGEAGKQAPRPDYKKDEGRVGVSLTPGS